jgi:peptide/nickel transport system substrate-binding protein
MHRRAFIGLGAVLATAAMLLAPSAAGGSSRHPAAGSTVITVEGDTGVTFTRNFNPFDATSVARTMTTPEWLTYDPLLQLDTLEAGVIHPWLATSYKWSNGGKTLTFDIRKAVKFTDGTPLTAADVAFTFNLINSNPSANIPGDPPLASPAKAPNSTTVVLTYKQAEYSNLKAIGGTTPIVPEHIWKSIKDPATATISTPVGSGPFVLKSFTTGLITYSRNSHYWDGTPPESEVRIPSYNSNSSASIALSDGLLTWAGNDIPSINKVFIDKNPSTNHDFFAPGNTVTLMFNVAKGGALATAKVRQAVSAGIDRAQLASEGESGYEKPATSSSGLILPNQSTYLTKSDTKDISTGSDPSKVASILSSDGYKKVTGVWEKNGKSISFAIEDPVSYSDYYADAQLITNELKADGIEASVDGVSATTWYADLGSGNFTTVIHWGNGGQTPYTQYQQWFTYDESAPIGKTATQDLGRFDTAAAVAALHTYGTTTPGDTSAINADVHTLANIMTNKAPDVPLLYGADWDEYSTATFTGWPTPSNPYMDPSPSGPWASYILMHLKVK